jgi:hypothetical protein
VAWAGVQRARAEGWISIKVVVRATQDGDESDFACVLGFPSPPKRDGHAAMASRVSDGGSCVEVVRGEL